MAMTFSKSDLARVWPSLAAAIAMVALGLAAVQAASQLRQAEARQQAAAQAQRAESQGRLAQARDEEQIIKQKLDRYNALARQGVIGEERRLDWIEAIRAIQNERKLLDLQYEISPQKPLDSALLPGASGSFEFLASNMQLRMKLLTEDDLLNFLADLRARAGAYILVRGCDVGRLPRASGEIGGLAPQLDASCVIDWITIRERKAA
ncbi:MAG TPA: hypothetical protein PKC23_03805 [Candidatus Desulfobacillus sp.]|nr:hypothetical protein [Candidatus Desulfobacillus sp.]